MSCGRVLRWSACVESCCSLGSGACCSCGLVRCAPCSQRRLVGRLGGCGCGWWCCPPRLLLLLLLRCSLLRLRLRPCQNFVVEGVYPCLQESGLSFCFCEPLRKLRHVVLPLLLVLLWSVGGSLR